MLARELYGRRDAHLKYLERELDVEIGARGSEVRLSGARPDVDLSERILRQLYALLGEGRSLEMGDVRRATDTLSRNPEMSLPEIFSDTVFVSVRNKVVQPKSVTQKRYIDAIRDNDLVFGIGPAGTGKTYLAVAMALAAYTERKIQRIILTRPAVEAGEKLGFLPGDLAEKVNPYLRPLLDAIQDLLDAERAQGMMEKGAIEVAPLAFMRGRTLNDSFIILDEAQNTTREQMKMFLTRLGFNSKAVVTGDITQVDLPNHRRSGLVEADKILRDVPGIEFVHFSKVDVVRHDLVQRILAAYESVEGTESGR
jgi:phosphate starvation-inducible PhoH-like protein